MITPELVAYVKAQVVAGFSREVIIERLRQQGWESEAIRQAFDAASGEPPVPPTPSSSAVSATEPAVGAVASHEKRSSRLHTVIIIVAAVVVLGLIGGAAVMAYRAGYFSTAAPYHEGNFMSGMVSALSTIESSATTIEGSFAMEAREADARPFAFDDSAYRALTERYERDSTRSEHINSILRFLALARSDTGTYPATLEALKAAYKNSEDTWYRAEDVVLKDPTTNVPYPYTVSKSGETFTLSVTFETAEAISSIQQQSERSQSFNSEYVAPAIAGKTVTLSSADDYVYLSAKPAKPFMVEFADMLQYAPPQMKVLLAITAVGDRSGETADWSVNANFEGDFDDLIFKVNVDALKSIDQYFVRVNNIPSLYEGFLPIRKGQWVSFDASSTEALGSSYGELADLPATFEEEVKGNVDNWKQFARKVLAAADEVRLLSFVEEPLREQVNGEWMYRYTLSPNPEAVVPFYNRLKVLVADFEGSPESKRELQEIVNDPELLAYLEGAEFAATAKYIRENVRLVVFVDGTGMPRSIEYRLRVVPPDSVERLRDRQGVLSVRMLLNQVNEPVTITPPIDAVPFEEIMEASPLMGARQDAKDASIKQSLSTLRSRAEIFYSENQTYSGWCTDSEAVTLLESINEVNEDAAYPVCNAAETGFAASAQLLNPADETLPYFCVDSQGNAKHTASGLAAGAITCPE